MNFTTKFFFLRSFPPHYLFGKVIFPKTKIDSQADEKSVNALVKKIVYKEEIDEMIIV